MRVGETVAASDSGKSTLQLTVSGSQSNYSVLVMVDFMWMMVDFMWMMVDFMWMMVDFMWMMVDFMWMMVDYMWMMVDFMWMMVDFMWRWWTLWIVVGPTLEYSAVTNLHCLFDEASDTPQPYSQHSPD